MSEVKSKIGTRSSMFRETFGGADVRAYETALLPWWNAKARSVPALGWTRFRHGEFEILSKLGIPISKLLHGEQTYEILKSATPADTIEFETVLSDVVEKSGASGKLTFLVFETEFKLAATAVAKARSTMVVREKA